MDTTVPKFEGIVRPRTYRWIGTSAENLYWDDGKNWAEGEYPNHPEATAVFADALQRNVNVILRKDIYLANLWFSEKKHSYTIQPEGDPAKARLLFQTGQQLANITLDEHNHADHALRATILHSCKKLTDGFKPPEERLASPEKLAKLVFSGDIGSYKEAPRASLNLDGFIELELSGNNSFIGPIVVSRGHLSIKGERAIPPRSSLSVISPGQVTIDKGITVNLGRFLLDGELMTPGKYVPHDFPEERMAEVSLRKPEGVTFRRLKHHSVSGGGIINVLS